MMDSLRTAIDVKAAIDKVETLNVRGVSPSIARSFYMECGYEDEEYDSEEEYSDSEEEDGSPHVEKISKLAETKSYTKSKYETIDGQIKINLPGVSYSGKVSNIQNEDGFNWFDAAETAPFGDVKSMTTVVDENVRKAKQIPSELFTVEDGICTRVEEIWTEKMGQFDGLVAVPYKINLYSNGGKFNIHRDTPETNLIGTFLIGLVDNSVNEWKKGGLKIQDGQKTVYWNSSTSGSWCGFYPDCYHEVMEVKGQKKKYHSNRELCKDYWCKDNHRELEDRAIRVSLAFKIYASQNLDLAQVDQQRLDKIVDHLKQIPDQNFGLVLYHSYNLTSDVLKGRDLKVLRALEQLDWKVEIIPIVIHITSETDYEGDLSLSDVNCQIYPFTEPHIDQLMDRENESTDDIDRLCKGLTYYNLGEIGLEWNRQSVQFVSYTGNESQPGEEDAVYLNKAFIICKD